MKYTISSSQQKKIKCTIKYKSHTVLEVGYSKVFSRRPTAPQHLRNITVPTVKQTFYTPGVSEQFVTEKCQCANM